MRSRPVPAVPRTAAEQGRVAFDAALKENVELLTGRRGAPLTALPNDATLEDVITKVNAIIARLQ